MISMAVDASCGPRIFSAGEYAHAIKSACCRFNRLSRPTVQGRNAIVFEGGG